jgi:microcystin-dependent protein
MSDAFVGEVRMFAGNVAPQGWAFCDGAELPLDGHDALFSLIGTTYGGDGRTMFGLPDLRGRIPIHSGTGPGQTMRRLGKRGGAETVALGIEHLPAHQHVQTGADNEDDPERKHGAGSSSTAVRHGKDTVSSVAGSMAPAGRANPHSNMMPYVGVRFIIAINGIYPARH